MNNDKVCQVAQTLIIVSTLLIVSGFPPIVNSGENPVAEKQTIVFTTIYPQNVPYYSKMSDVYKEAFGRLGYNFKLISQPGERALIDANQGVVDGEAARIMNLNKEKYANLLRVPCGIATVIDGAYAVDHSIKIDGWESLLGKSYRVGLFKGIKSIEQGLALYVDKKKIVTFSNAEQGIEMLKAGRIDIFLIGTILEDADFMKSDDFKNVKLAGIIEKKVLYPWLHKRHGHLVNPLADVLSTMKSEGRF